MFFFYSRITVRIPCYTELSCLLRCILLRWFLDFPCCWLPCQFWGTLIRYFVGRLSLNWGLSDVFHMVILGLWTFGRKTTEIIISKGMYYWYVVLLVFTLLLGLRYCLSSFPIVKVLFLLPLPVVFFGRKSLVQPTLKEWGVILLPWGQSTYLNCLEFLCMGNRSLCLPFLFSQSFLSVWTRGCLCLGYHLIFLYFTAQIAPILAFGNSFISFCVSLTCSHLFVF